MPRAKTKAAQPVGPEYTPQTPDDLTAEEAAGRERMTQRARELKLVDEQFGDNLPYEYERLIGETRFYLQESATALLEAGRRLMLIKEYEPHGRFTEALESIGIDPRAAQKMMQLAYRFIGGQRESLANLGKSKLVELLVLEDEELEALAEGETVAGVVLDDVDRMSVRDLRATLRKERDKRRKEKDVHDRLLADKNDKIDALDAALHRRAGMDELELNQFQEAAINSSFQELDAAFHSLTTALDDVLKRDRHDLPDALVCRAGQVMNLVNDRARALYDNYWFEDISEDLNHDTEAAQ